MRITREYRVKPLEDGSGYFYVEADFDVEVNNTNILETLRGLIIQTYVPEYCEVSGIKVSIRFFFERFDTISDGIEFIEEFTEEFINWLTDAEIIATKIKAKQGKAIFTV
jgi:hypothetical protein